MNETQIDENQPKAFNHLKLLVNKNTKPPNFVQDPLELKRIDHTTRKIHTTIPSDVLTSKYTLQSIGHVNVGNLIIDENLV